MDFDNKDTTRIRYDYLMDSDNKCTRIRTTSVRLFNGFGQQG